MTNEKEIIEYDKNIIYYSWPDNPETLVQVPGNSNFYLVRRDFVPAGFKCFIQYLGCSYVKPIDREKQVSWVFKIDNGASYIGGNLVNRAIGSIDNPLLFDPPFVVSSLFEAFAFNYHPKVTYCLEMVILGVRAKINNPQLLKEGVQEVKQLEASIESKVEKLEEDVRDKLEDLEEG